MRPMDSEGLKLCAFQGRVFELSLKHSESSSAIFIRRFMNSKAARRLDGSSFLLEASSELSIIEELEKEYGASSYGKIKYSGEELYWMGYIYRYWCYSRQKLSSQVYRSIAASELSGLYLPYHSLDPDAAIARICEAKGIADKEDYFERGLELFRKRLILREKMEGVYGE